MNSFRHLVGLLLMVAVVVGGAGCSDSPTESGSTPVISQLQVQGAQRVGGDRGLVFVIFSYADPDRDIDRFVFRVTGGGIPGVVTNPLSDANQDSGVASVQQAVILPAAGVEVEFLVSVLDRRGNRSNMLDGSFVAP